VRRYAHLDEQIEQHVRQYIADVRSGDFPSEDESY